MHRHPIPFYLKCSITNQLREATEKELADYALNPTNKSTWTKWNKANRIKFAQNLIQAGSPHNIAWAKAFDIYPDESTTPRARFIMT